MRIKLFTIPALGGEAVLEEMNSFLQSQKILEVESRLAVSSSGAAWCFCVKYADELRAVERERDKIDYKALLEPSVFARFSAFREIRKSLALSEKIPPYAVFTNEELAAMAKVENLTADIIKTIPGIGEKKLEKYGRHFIQSATPDDKKN
jgi:superfamily II DNA helicase RecQ